jgi:hypothetical protein
MIAGYFGNAVMNDPGYEEYYSTATGNKSEKKVTFSLIYFGQMPVT